MKQEPSARNTNKQQPKAWQRLGIWLRLSICLVLLPGWLYACTDDSQKESGAMVESNSGPGGDKPTSGGKPGTAAKPGASETGAGDDVFAASRKAPPSVPPVSLEGVRYEQVMSGAELGEPGRTGYLAAYDEETGERLWHLRVYAHERIEYLEQDVQDVFFVSMEPVAGNNRLLIENERGERFEVDVEVRKVVIQSAGDR